MIKGLVDLESLKNKHLIKRFLTVGDFREKNPDGEPPYFHVYKVKIENSLFDTSTKILSTGIKEGWYAVLWDNKRAWFIFEKKIIEIPYHWNKKDFEEVLIYSSSIGLLEAHFKHIKKSMDDW